MIQRVQTLYLLAAIAFLVVFCLVPFGYSLSATTSECMMAFGSICVILPAGISALLSLVAIFLYRSLDSQKSAVIVAMVFAVVTSCAGLVTVYFTEGASLGWGLALPLIAAVSLIAAWRGIRADQRLLRSYDRLR